jgi:hypothetical protein
LPFAYICVDLSAGELQALQGLRHEDGEDDDGDWEMADGVFADILDGHQPLEMSHEGGEFEALVDLEQRMRKE